jgi:hypothetical protein
MWSMPNLGVRRLTALERTLEPTTWLIVTDSSSTNAERTCLAGSAAGLGRAAMRRLSEASCAALVPARVGRPLELSDADAASATRLIVEADQRGPF